MKIAVLSGKGGTGKTFVSVNLAAVASKSLYVDCDVEEPNGHLFLKPQELKARNVSVDIPVFNQEGCNGCRKCVDFCKFNALAYINHKVIIFEEVCHSCGGCVLLCPQKALSETSKTIGQVRQGVSENVSVITGIMNPGKASGVPIVKELWKEISNETSDLTLIDCPPGSACVVMESIKDVDYCIIVAEPTIFGVDNARMVYQLVRQFDKPVGVVLNKCLEGGNPAELFCLENRIKVLGKIPFSGDLGALNSNGLVAVRENQAYQDLFLDLLDGVMREVQDEATVNP